MPYLPYGNNLKSLLSVYACLHLVGVGGCMLFLEVSMCKLY
nr:MAG TPA: hypothetical protein [Caudoviricetes sp.]